MDKTEEILAQLLAEQRKQTDLMRRALEALEALPQQLLGRLQPWPATGPHVIQLRKR